MNCKTIVVIIVAVCSLNACYLPPKPDEVAAANYGVQPSVSEMTSAVQWYMSKRLIDPYSAVYQCSYPTKAWVIGGAGEGNVELGKTYFGYLSTCTINAKNRLGGYTGANEYLFMIYEENGRRAIAHFDGHRGLAFVR